MSSVNQIFISTSNELGAFESGVAAHLLGVVASVLFGGVTTVIVGGTRGLARASTATAASAVYGW